MIYIAEHNPKFFTDFLDTHITAEKYEYTYAFNQIQSALNGHEQIYSDSVVCINDDNPESWILIIYSESFISVYGENWTSLMVTELCSSFNFSDSDSIISGSKELIETIFAEARIENYKIGKSRFFYRADRVTLSDYERYSIVWIIKMLCRHRSYIIMLC